MCEIRNELVQLYFETRKVSIKRAAEIVDDMIDFGECPKQLRAQLIEDVKISKRAAIVERVSREARERFRDFHDYLDWYYSDETDQLFDMLFREANLL